jgi:hypothetical protein
VQASKGEHGARGEAGSLGDGASTWAGLRRQQPGAHQEHGELLKEERHLLRADLFQFLTELLSEGRLRPIREVHQHQARPVGFELRLSEQSARNLKCN